MHNRLKTEFKIKRVPETTALFPNYAKALS